MHVLAVCSGNICRSPALERLARVTWPSEASVTISSAGTEASPGEPMHPETARVLTSLDADVTGFEARRLTASELRAADLVVVLERSHRSRVVQVVPAVLRRTFTLNELARICGRIESAEALGDSFDERLQTLTLHAAELRTAPVDPSDDDIADPISGPSSAHDAAVSHIRLGLEAIDRVLLGVPVPD